MRAKIYLTVLLLFAGLYMQAQNNPDYFSEVIQPRTRVIIDNDFGGDPDGLFQLAHHLLSPSVEIRGIIGSHHYKEFYGHPGNVDYACSQVGELLHVMRLSGKIPVYKGADSSLVNLKTPHESAGAKAIVEEAMRADTEKPLYIVCGAGLTNIASAYLMEPEIAKRIVLVWIGGPEYEGLSIVPPQKHREYNLGIDINAARVIYNFSDIPVWQVPRDAYRQALYSYPELVHRVKPAGVVGNYLVEKLADLMKRSNRSLGEAYVLGDNPLVLLTALQSSWETDPSSSRYVKIAAPGINEAGFYEENTEGRKIRVFTNLDVRLMFEDMVAKLSLFAAEKVPLDSIRLSDPAILTDHQTNMYYMTGTGGMLWKSKDLKLWDGPYRVVEHDKNSWMGEKPMIWAAELHKYNGKYYYFATFTNKEIMADTLNGKALERRASHVLVSNKPDGPYVPMKDKTYLPARMLTLDGTFWVDKDEKPYMIYCHEWLQNNNGTMEKIELKPDLSGSVGTGEILFRASDSPWSREEIDGKTGPNRVTDGPYLFRTGTGRLGMIWSSWIYNVYTQGVAYSESGTLDGPWIQENELITPPDFGHGMLFQTLNGQWLMSVHSHKEVNGRYVRIPHLFRIDLLGDKLIVGDRYIP